MSDGGDATEPIEDEPDYDVVSFLHQAGERYKEHLEQLRAQREAEEASQVTGRPTITAMAAASRRGGTTCVQERLHQLWQKRLEREEALRLAKAAEETARDGQPVKPKPQITPRAQGVKPRGSQADITAKFLNERRERVEQLQEAAIRRETEHVLPKPRITAHHAADEARRRGKDIADHLLGLEQDRQRRLFEAVECQESGQQSGPAHRPQITKRAQSMQRDGDVVTRLYTQHYQPYAYDEEYARHCTFAPNTGSHKYRDPLEHLPVHLRVLERSVQHKSRIASTEHDESAAARPTISERSRAIVDGRRAKDPLGALSPGSRLYESGMRSLAAQSRRSEAETADGTAHGNGCDINAECRFRPQLNPTSKRLADRRIKTVMQSLDSAADGGGKRPLGITREMSREVARELLWRDAEQRKQRELEKLAAERAAAEEAAMTPARQRHRFAVTPDRATRFFARAQMTLQKRDAQLQELRAEEREREVDGCTFRPVIHEEMPVPLVSSAAAAAPGVELHWERMERARQRREQGEDVGSKSASKYTGRPTTPRAFNLSTSRRRSPHRSDIASLRPPLGRAEMQQLLLDDEDDADVYVSASKQAERKGKASQGALQTRAVSPPRAQPQHAAPPPRRGPYQFATAEQSPVDFILTNHQNIIRGLQRQ